MVRRWAFVVLITAGLSGCAAMAQDDFAMDATPTPVAEAPTPAADYSAGLDLHARGDDAGAREHWMRCVEESPAAAPEHLDCLVALEKLAPPAGNN